MDSSEGPCNKQLVSFKSGVRETNELTRSSFLTSLEETTNTSMHRTNGTQTLKRSPVGYRRTQPTRSNSLRKPIRTRTLPQSCTPIQSSSESSNDKTTVDDISPSTPAKCIRQPAVFRNGRLNLNKDYWNPHSRIGWAFLEFGYDDNPFCNLLLKHFLAAAIQAIWRGYVLRKRFRDVIRNAKVSAQEKQKTVVGETWLKNARIGQKSKESVMIKQSKPHAWNLQDVISGLKAKGEQQGVQKGKPYDDTDSDWSDLDAEELQELKYRCKTPPWQRQENARWAGVNARINYKPMRGKLDVLWDVSDCKDRVQSVIERREMRFPNRDMMTIPDQHMTELPEDFVNDLLQERFARKYKRLGIVDIN